MPVAIPRRHLFRGAPLSDNTTTDIDETAQAVLLLLPQRLLSVDEVAEALGFSARTLLKHIGSGKLRALHMGRNLRLLPTDVAAFVSAQAARRRAG